MADEDYQPLVFFRQGGSELVVKSGGKITIDTGGELWVNGVLITSTGFTGITGPTGAQGLTGPTGPTGAP